MAAMRVNEHGIVSKIPSINCRCRDRAGRPRRCGWGLHHPPVQRGGAGQEGMAGVVVATVTVMHCAVARPAHGACADTTMACCRLQSTFCLENSAATASMCARRRRRRLRRSPLCRSAARHAPSAEAVARVCCAAMIITPENVKSSNGSGPSISIRANSSSAGWDCHCVLVRLTCIWSQQHAGGSPAPPRALRRRGWPPARPAAAPASPASAPALRRTSRRRRPSSAGRRTAAAPAGRVPRQRRGSQGRRGALNWPAMIASAAMTPAPTSQVLGTLRAYRSLIAIRRHTPMANNPSSVTPVVRHWTVFTWFPARCRPRGSAVAA